MTEPAQKTTTPDQPIDIADRLELFVDDYLIEEMDGVAMRLHSPQKMPLPRSSLSGGYMTVIKDADLYRGYYRRYKPGFKGERGDGSRGECTCYAESRDGIEWTEPDLGLLEGDIFGNVKNAILDTAPFAHNFSPFLDSRPGIPTDQRYKALAGTRGSGLHTFASEDSTSVRGGIRVELQDADRQALPGFALDDCETIIGDSIEHVVAWQGGRNVSRYTEQPIRIRFVIQDSDLYSLRFQ